jgi:hypothetical protein
MTKSGVRAEYSSVSKWLHWLILALLVIQFAIAWTMPEIGRGSVPIGLIGWHLSLGLTILAVMVVRLAWRLTHPVPPVPADLSPALATLSRATHNLLYAVLIARTVTRRCPCNACHGAPRNRSPACLWRVLSRRGPKRPDAAAHAALTPHQGPKQTGPQHDADHPTRLRF